MNFGYFHGPVAHFGGFVKLPGKVYSENHCRQKFMRKFVTNLFSGFWEVRIMIFSYFGGPWAHFGGPGTHSGGPGPHFEGF